MRPNILRNFTERTVHTPSPHLDRNGLGRRWVDKLAQLDVEVSQDTADQGDALRLNTVEVIPSCGGKHDSITRRKSPWMDNYGMVLLA